MIGIARGWSTVPEPHADEAAAVERRGQRRRAPQHRMKVVRIAERARERPAPAEAPAPAMGGELESLVRRADEHAATRDQHALDLGEHLQRTLDELDDVPE